MKFCEICGGAIFPGNQAMVYVGPVCAYGGTHPAAPQSFQIGSYQFIPNPLTADDVRRIVREEIEKARIEWSGGGR